MHVRAPFGLSAHGTDWRGLISTITKELTGNSKLKFQTYFDIFLIEGGIDRLIEGGIEGRIQGGKD